MGFGDVFAGWEQAAQEHHKTLLQMDYQDKRELAQNYAKMAEDPRYDEPSQNVFKQRSLHILTLEPGKKLPKEYLDYTIKVQPPAPAPVNVPGSPGSGGGANPIFGGTPDKLPPTSSAPGAEQYIQGVPYAQQAEIEPRSVQAPAPPPHQLFDQMPFEQQMERLRKETQAKQRAMTPQKVNGGTTTIEGQNIGWTKWRDPVSGNEWTELDPYDKSFAARLANSAPLDTADLAKLVANQIPNPLPKGQATPEMLAKIKELLPGSDVVMDASSGNYYIRSGAYKTGTYGGQVVNQQQTPPSGEPLAGAQVGGLATGALPRTTTSPQIRGLDPATGNVYVGTATRTQTTAAPGMQPQSMQVPTVPLPQQPPIPMPPMPQAGPPPPAAPPSAQSAPQTYQGLPGEEAKIITEDVIKRLMDIPINKANKISREGVITALKASGWTEPGAGGAPAAQPISQQTPLQPAAPPTAPPAGGRGDTGMNPALFNKEQDIMRAVRPAMSILVGDPADPLFESMESFAHIADDPVASMRVAKAFRVIMKGLADTEKASGPDAALNVIGIHVSGGSLSDIAKNFLGIPSLSAQASATAVNQAIEPLTYEEKRMLARSIAGYATVVGFRQLTRGSAYKFSTDIMEKELPIPGITGINSSKDYYNKLAQLTKEPAATVARMFSLAPDEKEFFRKSAVRLNVKGLASKVQRNPQTGQSAYLVNGKWLDEDGKPIQ